MSLFLHRTEQKIYTYQSRKKYLTQSYLIRPTIGRHCHPQYAKKVPLQGTFQEHNKQIVQPFSPIREKEGVAKMDRNERRPNWQKHLDILQ
jgi:hypothetical protein